jgi:hypothetical protein
MAGNIEKQKLRNRLNFFTIFLPMAQKYDIFISYRHEGGMQDARLIDEKLRNSGYSVSFDIDTLGRGKFTDTLKTRLKDCKDFIAIFEATYYGRFFDANGNVQPEEVLNEDWCYLELKHALQLGKNIIPLVPKDFIFPKNLPKEVKEVAEMNAIQLTEKEFKEIFEHKVKAYLFSKPRFTYRHKKSIISFLSLAIIAVIIYLVYEWQNSKREAAEAEAKAEADRTRLAFVVDSLKKVAEEQIQSIRRDSIKANEVNEVAKEAVKEVTEEKKRSVATSKIQLHWVGNGDETGKILVEKLAGAELKNTKCTANGINVIASTKPKCVPSSTGRVKCTYTPQITVTKCGSGAQVDQMIYEQINSSDINEVSAKNKMYDNLRNAKLNSWVSRLKTLRSK